MIISMEELLLRPTTPTDAAALLALYRVVAGTPNSGLARQSDEIEPDYVESFLGGRDSGWMSIGAFHVGDLVGEIHAARMQPRQFHHVLTDLTIAVDPRMQGHGVGSRLFGELFARAARLDPPITRIELVARTGNAAAIRLYERLGFHAEGRFRDRVRLPDGRVEDDIPMARMVNGAR
jgi:RimJ/RimL family protein N-acetyltransferase